MLELAWVSDEREAQNPKTRRTLLWERWSRRKAGACPFGICLRPGDSQNTEPPFPSWEYRPDYLPSPLFMSIGEAEAEEPMWIYLSFMRRVHREQHFVEHPIGIREITGLTLTTPVPLRSEVAQLVIESGILGVKTGPVSLLEFEFDGNRQKEQMDFRPDLPVIFHM
jgi:hypothetical protein